MRAVIAVAACALVLPGCGGSAEGGAKRSGRLVDFSQKPPYVNALDIDPATGDFLMTTNRGFFRIDARTHAVARVRATVTASSQSAGVGTFLDILSTGPGRLLGSGHPDVKGQLPPYLGLIASADGGRSFVERFTPPGLIIDFEVDPGDADHLLAATDARLMRSTDGGKRWRPIDTGQGIRLAWPAADALYRAEKNGTISRSRDGGERWARVGKVPGEPYAFKALGPERLDLALSDGTIAATQDGGRHWKETFRP
jgi:photosystem II stability/assembly factor-like uncharacterized protein